MLQNKGMVWSGANFVRLDQPMCSAMSNVRAPQVEVVQTRAHAALRQARQGLKDAAREAVSANQRAAVATDRERGAISSKQVQSASRHLDRHYAQ